MTKIYYKCFTINNLYKILSSASIFLIAFYFIKINYGFYFRTNLVEIFILLSLIIWLFINLKENLIAITLFLRREKIFLVGLIFLFFGLSISLIYSIDKFKTLGAIKSWFLLPIIFTLIIRFSKVKIDKFQILYLSGLFVSLISIFYLILGKLTYDHRLQSFFSHPNYLAMFLAPSFLIIFNNLIENRKNIKIEYAYLLPIVISLFFTFSYNSWLSVFITISLYLIIYRKFNFKKMVLILLIFLTILLSQLNNPKLKNLFDNNHSSFMDRLVIYKVSLKVAKDHLLTGIGLNNFQQAYLEYQKYFRPYPNWAVPMSHNLYLDFLLQLGLFGFFGFILILIWAYSVFLKNPNLKIGFLIITFYLVYGLFDSPYFKPDLSLIFWISFI